VGSLVVIGLALLVFVFPTVAALVGPENRRAQLFLLTLLILLGQLGVAAAAVAQDRPPKPQSGQRPTHLAVTWWHSEQRYCGRVLATPVTVSG
jgi:hypothetical protein